MAEPQPSQQTEDDGLDPATERVRRKLVRFMAINLGVLFLALMAVVAAIVYRVAFSTPDGETATETAEAIPELPAPPPGALLTGDIALPQGARLVSHALSGDRLALDVEIGTARQILIYDIAQGRMIGRFTLAPER